MPIWWVLIEGFQKMMVEITLPTNPDIANTIKSDPEVKLKDSEE